MAFKPVLVPSPKKIVASGCVTLVGLLSVYKTILKKNRRGLRPAVVSTLAWMSPARKWEACVLRAMSSKQDKPVHNASSNRLLGAGSERIIEDQVVMQKDEKERKKPSKNLTKKS